MKGDHRGGRGEVYLEVLFTPLLVSAFVFVELCFIARRAWIARRRRRAMLVIASASARRLGLVAERDRDCVHLRGTLGGRPVHAMVFPGHCRASATFVEPLLPAARVVCCRTIGAAGAKGRGLEVVEQGRRPLPPWLTRSLLIHGRGGLTILADRLMLLDDGPLSVDVCVAAVIGAERLARVIEAARPECNLR